jgi:predicted Zn-dependent protease
MLSWLIAVTMGMAVFASAQDNPLKPAPDSSPAASDPKQLPGNPAPAGDNQQPTATDDAPAPAKSPQIKHDGGKKDVDAVGHRKVGGFDIYSIEDEIKMGREYAQELDRNLKLIQDPVVNEYVNRIGQNLVRNSDTSIPFTFKVVDDDDINAMALPGGFLYVNSGLIFAADDEAELAGAMAHEVAHVAMRHATRTLTRANIAQLLAIPISIMIPLPVNVPGLVLPATFLKFSRDFEAEADYFGIQYMYKAGYDPNALVTFFEKVHALEKRKPGAVSRVFASHPLTPERIKKTQKEIATILPARDHYVETTSEFSEVKARLAVTRNRLRMADTGESKPTLRRAPNDGAPDEKKKDDDRPVLNRRDQLNGK